MPIRTFNYTERKRILREDAKITIREDKNGYFFDVDLSLKEYNLPAEASIYIEAYRQTQYMRFNFGQVGRLRYPEDRKLTIFSSTEGVLFRVKVVADSTPRGLLLAEADQIHPRKLTDDDDSRIPLLPVTNESLGDDIWRLEFEGDQTILKVNSNLGEWRILARDPMFVSLVYPAVFRLILIRILVQEKHHDTEDLDDWRSRWLRFAISLPGVCAIPDEKGIELDDWIDDTVAAFSRHHYFLSQFEQYWTGAQKS